VGEERFVGDLTHLEIAGAEEVPALAERLRQLACQVMALPPASLPLDKPLSALGLDSLDAIDLAHRIEIDTGVELDLIAGGPSCLALAAEVLARRSSPAGDGEVPAADAAGGADRADLHPLSASQQAVWLLQRLAPESSAYHLVGMARVRGELDPAALERAWDALVARHSVLRTTFEPGVGGPRQRVRDAVPSGFTIERADRLAPAELARRAAAAAYRPFDLEAGPLLRLAVFSQDAARHLLVLSVHHIVADFWSVGLLVDQLGALYRRQREGEGAAAEPLAPALSYADYVRWQARLLRGPRGERLWRYWSGRLSGALPRLELPTDRPRPPRLGTASGAVALQLAPELAAGIRQFSSGRSTTVYTTLLAAFELLLGRLADQTDLLVGTPMAARRSAALAGLVGYCTNLVALRADLAGDPSFARLAEQARDTVLGALANQDYPFPLLVERLRPQREESRPTLVEVLFVLYRSQLPGQEELAAFAIGQEGGRMRLGDLRLEAVRREQQDTRFDLELQIAETGGALGASLVYRRDLFDGTTAARLLGHFATLAAAAVAAPQRRCSELPLLAAPERHQLLVEWNDTEAAPPAGGRAPCLIDLFARQARHAPDAVAVAQADRQLTYRELDRLSACLAAALMARGVGSRQLVALAVERTVELPAALLGIFRAGCACLPLDLHAPPARLARLLVQSAVTVIVTSSHRLMAVADAARQAAAQDALGAAAGRRRRLWTFEELLADAAAAAAPAAPAAPAASCCRPSGPEDLAYVLYTSGSTGLPKGVMVEQRGLVNHLQAKIAGLSLGPADRVAQTAAIGFDISLWQLLAPLLAGARVEVIEDELTVHPGRLVGVVASRGISIFQAVPSVLWAIADELEESAARPDLAGLRWLLATAEELPGELCRRWLRLLPGVRVINGYGPTEASDNVSHHRVPAPPRSAARVPIGRPLSNVRLYVLDRLAHPLPIGVSGELCAAGVCLSRGYLDDPRRTAERFLPNPFAVTPGERIYCTGDLVRSLPDGQLEYLARTDQQVKIRGWRIEPAEIELALGRHAAVGRCAVAAREGPRGGPCLVAYVTARPERQAATADELRRWLETLLPAAMVPAAFVFLPELPLTAHGKVDRRALPPPDWADQGAGLAAAAAAAPGSPTEELVAEIWRSVLGHEHIPRDGDFFALGGHSLLGTRVISRIEAVCGVVLPLRLLFEARTVAALAREIDQRRGRGAAPAGALEPLPKTAPPPLSFAQERLWTLEHLGEGGSSYNMPGAVLLRGRLDSGALERSLGEVLRRHAALRASFHEVDGRPVLRIAPAAGLRLAWIDLRRLGLAATDPLTRRLAAAEAGRPFALTQPPLLRARLLLLDDDLHVLLLTVHHIVCDAWSLTVLIRELVVLYTAFVAGRPSPLPELNVQYGDFAHWQREQLRSGAWDAQLAYWQRVLAGVPPPLALSSRQPPPGIRRGRGGQRAFPLPPALVAGLRDLSRREGITLFMTMLAGFATLLYRHTGREDLVVGTAIAHRNRIEIEALIGMFVNMLALRVDLSGNPAFRELLQRIKEVTLAAFECQDAPFEQLVRDLQPRRHAGQLPLFQVAFGLQQAPPAEVALPRLTLRPLALGLDRARYDLTLWIQDQDGALTALWTYDLDLFAGADVERLQGHYAALLGDAVTRPAARLEALEIDAAAEREKRAEGRSARRRAQLEGLRRVNVRPVEPA
jgi:amino acid adenylation domain-containing protein